MRVNRLVDLFVMTEILEKPCKQKQVTAKKCPDYDCECADVKDHLHCWTGGTVEINNKFYETEPVDGYCPYVFGMKA